MLDFRNRVIRRGDARSHCGCHGLELGHVTQKVETWIFFAGDEQSRAPEIEAIFGAAHSFHKELANLHLIGQMIHASPLIADAATSHPESWLA